MRGTTDYSQAELRRVIPRGSGLRRRLGDTCILRNEFEEIWRKNVISPIVLSKQAGKNFDKLFVFRYRVVECFYYLRVDDFVKGICFY